MSEADNRMEELADRVERADPNDWRALRTLAKDIYRELNKLPELVTGGYGWQEDNSGWWLQTGEDQRCPRKRIDPPNWLGSLDAAMSLVPEDHGWCLYYDGSCSVGPIPDRGCIMEDRFIGEGETPALGLTAAALRARALTDPRP